MATPDDPLAEDKSGSNILVTLSLLPILWAIFFESNSGIPPIAIMWFMVACMAGSILWLLFTRCKFATAQVLFTLALTSLELALIARYYPLHHHKDLLLLGCAPLLSFVGLFTGARLAGNPADHSQSAYWLRFLIGLLLPVLIPSLIAVAIFLILYFQRHP
jgi:hypothetical protein